jgi:hypothetical protein
LQQQFSGHFFVCGKWNVLNGIKIELRQLNTHHGIHAELPIVNEELRHAA